MRKSIALTNGSEMELNRIFCVGRNYTDHAKEMGEGGQEPPFFFLKPHTALLETGQDFKLPRFSQNIHHEVELVVALKGSGRNLNPKEASELVYGVGIGLDMTARDMQSLAKSKGRPWDLSKGFDGSAICSSISPIKVDQITNLEFILKKNGRVKQHGRASDMIWSTSELISELSHYIELKEGDLLFTGTPSGVGEVIRGDYLSASITNSDINLSFFIA
ncbi:fumarylacetoacetate hydrolase family protein [Sessilibacter corallicola]|uniref:Fumarylacetoacetate hydrolase family protein n=1 Tax=Sessilibacter corallicola TaxID=2904075 RepID=A0ABQ0ADM4_9GAMM